MSDLNWVWLAPVGDIPLREGRVARIGDRTIAVFNLGDRVLAVDNRCPHRGGPLADGIVAGETVVCPLHGWKVNLQSGAVARPTDVASCVTVYPTRIDNGVVVIGVPATLLPGTDEAA